MNNIEKNQDSNLNKNSQGQGGRTEETREGRDTMRGASAGSEGNRNLSSRDQSGIEEDEDEFEDTEEASLDAADEGEEEDEEEEEGADLEGTERSDLGFNRGRDTNRDQSRI